MQNAFLELAAKVLDAHRRASACPPDLPPNSTTYMMCFDGSCASGPDMCEIGAGACVFQINTAGRKNTRLREFDQTVYMNGANLVAKQAEYMGLFAGFVGWLKVYGVHSLISQGPALPWHPLA